MRTLGFAIAFATAFAWTATAQVNVQVGKDGVKVDAQGARDNKVAVAHRASKIAGMTVKNRANEDLGKVEDLVIDERGNVRYAAVSFGGFLGFNDKLFAVPWKALTIKNDVNSTTQYVELNVSKRYLENAPGFPSDKWPTFADPEVNAKVDAFYLREQDKNDPNRIPTPRQ